MKKVLLIVICCLLLFTGCINNYDDKMISNEITSSTTKNNDTRESDNIKVIINNKSYILKLEKNKTVDDFINLLPQEFTMNELNGNEKYVYMDSFLATQPYNPKHIEKGDVMLYGNNCLVIFYKSFDTSYSYSKIGHIENLQDLENDSVIVKFEK